MFDIFVENSGDGGIVNVSGSLLFQDLGKLKPIIQDILRRSNHLVVNIDMVTEMDLSVLQFLCALHKTTIQQDKGFALFGRRNRQLQGLICRSGYLRHAGCGQDSRKECLWLGGGCE